MRDSRYDHAIQRWVAALNARGSRALVDAAVHPDIVVERYGFGSKTGALVEVLKGAPSVAEWFGLTPEGVRFEIAGSVMTETERHPEVARARYQLDVADFVGHGTWTFRVHDDGRVSWLEHMPDSIPDAIEEGDHRSGHARSHQDHPHLSGHHH